MKNKIDIISLLDLDLYKLTVHQLAFHRFSNVNVDYAFTCRNALAVDFFNTISYRDICELVYDGGLDDLKLTEEELAYLRARGYFEESYLQALASFRFRPKDNIIINNQPSNCPTGWTLKVTGPVFQVLPYETILLSAINNLYGKKLAKSAGSQEEQDSAEIGCQRLRDKIALVEKHNYDFDQDIAPYPLKIIEFGTRRRASQTWQDYVLRELLARLPKNLVGTSNVYLAKKYNVPPIGTFGHELPMLMQGLVPIQHSQREAFKIWIREYRGLWGIALADTLGFEKFFKDFTLEMAKAYDGVRHDSLDPFVFGDRIIAMYKGFGIDAKTKRIVFSDSLDIPKAIKLCNYFGGKIIPSFGIGTNLTNDLGQPVPQIVIKMTKSHGQPVVKLACPEKVSCEDEIFMNYARHAVDNF